MRACVRARARARVCVCVCLGVLLLLWWWCVVVVCCCCSCVCVCVLLLCVCLLLLLLCVCVYCCYCLLWCVVAVVCACVRARSRACGVRARVCELVITSLLLTEKVGRLTYLAKGTAAARAALPTAISACSTVVRPNNGTTASAGDLFLTCVQTLTHASAHRVGLYDNRSQSLR